MLVATLTGERTLLSPPTLDDVDRITDCCGESAIVEWTTMPTPYRRDDALAFVTRVVPVGWADRSPTWAVRDPGTSVVLGMVGLKETDPSAAEIGFWLAADNRGRGVMTDAVNTVCHFAFADDGMGLERIEWRAFVGNDASAAVARRCGFVREGVARAGLNQRGTRRDAWVGARLASDPHR